MAYCPMTTLFETVSHNVVKIRVYICRHFQLVCCFQIFENIRDATLLTRNVLPRPMYLKSLKITPKQGHIYPEMKVELYGYDGTDIVMNTDRMQTLNVWNIHSGI